MAEMQTVQVASTINRRDIVLALGFALIIANLLVSGIWRTVWSAMIGASGATPNGNNSSKAPIGIPNPFVPNPFPNAPNANID